MAAHKDEGPAMIDTSVFIRVTGGSCRINDDMFKKEQISVQKSKKHFDTGFVADNLEMMVQYKRDMRNTAG